MEIAHYSIKVPRGFALVTVDPVAGTCSARMPAGHLAFMATDNDAIVRAAMLSLPFSTMGEVKAYARDRGLFVTRRIDLDW